MAHNYGMNSKTRALSTKIGGQTTPAVSLKKTPVGRVVPKSAPLTLPKKPMVGTNPQREAYSKSMERAYRTTYGK